MAVPEAQQFGNILLGGKDQHRDESNGTMRLHSGGLAWKSRKSGNIIPISKDDLRELEWLKVPNAYQLRVRAKGGFVYRFSGFRNQDKDTVKSYCKETFDVELTDAQYSYKGWSWGSAGVEGTRLAFNVEGRQAFELPLNDITQASSTKNEAVVEVVNDDTALPEDEMVSEIRFAIPMREDDAMADMELTPAEAFVDSIKQSGDLEKAGKALCAIEDVPVQVPRGRYDIEMFDKYLKMHGKQHDYKILYTNVSGLLLLDKPDGYHMALCLSLEHPLRQGATSYQHVVMQLPIEKNVEVELDMGEDEIQERFEGKLEKSEFGAMPDVLSKIISRFTGKKMQLMKPGSGFNGKLPKDTQDRARYLSIRCSLKATDGQLYPMEKCFFFICNKPLQLDFDKVATIEFNRVTQGGSSASSRTFDITVYMKDSSGPHQFVNLRREDYKELFAFLQGKKIRIKNITAASQVNFDESDGGGGSDDDMYMKRMKEKGKQKEEADDDDDDDEDDEDDDFVPGGESDVDEEYDEGDVQDDERANIKSKSKKRKEGGRGSGSDGGSASGSGSGSDSDSEEEKKPKKKEKAKEKAKASPKEAKGKAPMKKKQRKKKDKDAPKKALSAYMFFTNASRARIKEENPEATFGELGKIAGLEWGKMDAEARAPFAEKAEEDKRRFEKETAAYKAAQRAAAAEPATSSDDEEPAAAASGSDSD